MKTYIVALVAFGTNTTLDAGRLTVSNYGDLHFCTRCESQVDMAFAGYLDEFKEEATHRKLNTLNVPLVIRFSKEQTSDIIGDCLISNNIKARRYVVISKTYWEHSKRSARKALVFHELAHCLLQVELHSTSGIMSEFIPSNVDDKMKDDFWRFVSGR